MQLEEWNDALLAWFVFARPRERVYLRADDAELERLNAEQRLGLDSPSGDLVKAVQAEVYGDGSLRWLRRRGEEWRRRASPDEAPPWLGVLAVAVLVVSRETERGSLAFYEPFSQALGLRERMSPDDYEESVFGWWLDLGRWLTDVNGGSRGLPSWRRIPKQGPRCIIGHPYTQVLLRREDLRDVDAFLSSLGQLSPGDLEITDPAAAGADLLDRLTRWAQRRRISPRLWGILFGEGRGAADSLQWMLVDRLLDEVEGSGLRPHEREARLVVTLDDWDDCRLRFSVLIPSTVNLLHGETLELAGEQIGPLHPGEPYVVPVPLDAIALDEGVGLPVGDEVTLVYRAADVLILVAREWSLWCAVDDADPGEMAYLLVNERANLHLAPTLRLLETTGIVGVPAGWRLYGPLELPSHDDTASGELPLRGEVQAVPRLVGGLEVARHAYLAGGPPGIWLPSEGTEVSLRVDGQTVGLGVEGSIVRLASLGLGSGAHQVDVGPYRLSFELLAIEQVPPAPGSLVRTARGEVLPAGHTGGEVTFVGAIRRPPASYDPVTLCPLGLRVVVFGEPGMAYECSPTMASWAIAAGLPQMSFEPTRRSSFLRGAYPFRPIVWVAVQGEGGTWSVTRVPWPADGTADGTADVDVARAAVASIGEGPKLLPCSFDDPAQAASEWAAYARSVLELR